MEIKIRDVRAEDTNDITYIMKTSMKVETKNDIIKKHIEEIDNKNEVMYVATIDDKVVGVIQAEKYRLLYADKKANVLALAIDNNYQGLGIGKKLIEKVEKWTKKIGYKTIRLNSGIERINAHRFYKHLGFTEEKKQIRFSKEI